MRRKKNENKKRKKQKERKTAVPDSAAQRSGEAQQWCTHTGIVSGWVVCICTGAAVTDGGWGGLMVGVPKGVKMAENTEKGRDSSGNELD